MASAPELPAPAAASPLRTPLLDKNSYARPAGNDVKVAHKVAWRNPIRRFSRRTLAGMSERQLASIELARELVAERPASRLAVMNPVREWPTVFDFAPAEDESNVEQAFVMRGMESDSPAELKAFVSKATTGDRPYYSVLVMDAPYKSFEAVRPLLLRYALVNRSAHTHALTRADWESAGADANKCIVTFVDTRAGAEAVKGVTSTLLFTCMMNTLYTEGFVD